MAVLRCVALQRPARAARLRGCILGRSSMGFEAIPGMSAMCQSPSPTPMWARRRPSVRPATIGRCETRSASVRSPALVPTGRPQPAARAAQRAAPWVRRRGTPGGCPRDRRRGSATTPGEAVVPRDGRAGRGEPGGNGVEPLAAVDREARVRLARRGEGVLEADVELLRAALEPDAAAAASSDVGVGSSSRPRTPPKKRRASSSNPGGAASCTWSMPAIMPRTVRTAHERGQPTVRRARAELEHRRLVGRDPGADEAGLRDLGRPAASRRAPAAAPRGRRPRLRASSSLAVGRAGAPSRPRARPRSRTRRSGPGRRMRREHEPRARVRGAQDAAEPAQQRLQARAPALQPRRALEARASARGRAHLPVDVGEQRDAAVRAVDEQAQRGVEPLAVEVRVEVAEARRQAAAHLPVGRRVRRAAAACGRSGAGRTAS